jgi:DNA-binding response OmpR family regulator
MSMDDLLVILVVEDDQQIQSIIEQALTEAGFESLIAASGEEAATLLHGNRTGFRAIVTDINLPGELDGWAVARQAREFDPALPVIYMTGEAVDQWPVEGVPNSLLLTKPFAPAQLVTAISGLLNAGRQPARP